MLLVVAQAFLRRHRLLASRGIVAVDRAQLFQYVLTGLGKVLDHLHKTSPGMRQTMAHDDSQLLRQLGQVAGERIAHLQGRSQFGGALPQHIRQVLAGVLASGEE